MRRFLGAREYHNWHSAPHRRRKGAGEAAARVSNLLNKPEHGVGVLTRSLYCLQRLPPVPISEDRT